MKTLSGTIVFSLSVVTFIIGIHQTMTVGISFSYPLFTLSGGLFLLYLYLKVQRKEKEEREAKAAEAAKKRKPKRKR